MNSLLKLKIYSGDDSDSSSDSELEKSNEERFPLPEFLLGSSTHEKVPTEEINEEGKIRNFPHVPGNWTSYIYIPVNSVEFLSYLNELLEYFKPLGLKLSDDFHISLTRTVILRHHWISDFITSVKNSLVKVKSFKIHMFGLKAYSNEQKTRSFLSLKVETGEDNLLHIVYLLNNCLKEYNLQSFYEEPSFHVSLLWCPGDKFIEINKYIDLLPINLKNFEFHQEVSYCVCASGNKKFTFNFCD